MQEIRPKLLLLSNAEQVGEVRLLDCYNRCCELAKAGSVLVVLRDPELSVQERLRLGEKLRRLTRATGQLLSVRDRLDLAMLLDSDALHLGESSILPERVRDAVGERFWLSRAWHDLSRTPPEHTDAYLLSPVCAPRKNHAAVGLLNFAQFCGKHTTKSVFALGGVDAQNAAACLRAGAVGVAVMGAILQDESPTPLLSALGILKA